MQEKIEQLNKQIQEKDKELEDIKNRTTIDDDDVSKQKSFQSFG